MIVTWNRGAERLYGYTAPEIIGRSISVLIAPGQPDDLPDVLARVRRESASNIMRPYEERKTVGSSTCR
jgi:PAS domain S-box-containing protein